MTEPAASASDGEARRFDTGVEDWPWLRLDWDADALSGRWIKLTFKTALLEALDRPMIRCLVAGEPQDQALPAALFGTGVWFGLIPQGTREIWISPTRRSGPFAFAVVALDVLSYWRLGRMLLARAPRRWAIWVAAPFIGQPRWAAIQVRRVLSPTSRDHYDGWRRSRSRPFDAAFDARGAADRLQGHLRLLTRVAAADMPALPRLVERLARQSYKDWSLIVLVEAGPSGTSLPGPLDPRVSVLSGRNALADILGDLAGTDLVGPLGVDDDMPDYALAAFLAAASDAPDADGFFGDTDAVDRQGRYGEPRLRPDWSPVLFSALHDLGPATAFRVKVLRALPDLAAIEMTGLPDRLAEAIDEGRVSMRHIRRVLRTLPLHRSEAPTRVSARPAPQARGDAMATIIVPTRDRLDLLQGCIESLGAKPGLTQTEVIVVDNGSTEAAVQTYLHALSTRPQHRVIHDDGPFNFSRLCNRAAALARGTVLVFLNNDIEVVEAGWLDRLVGWAQRPDIGAAGAKLLYPTGRVQHAGVVVGLDGMAGHIGRQSAPDDPGPFGRMTVPHEVLAVTAACLAVEKRKFDAVGGFDERNLPVDLNDIDLCLRLTAEGWTSVLDPEATLIHHESASRGVAHRPERRYRLEQRTFRERWLSAIRDDPYYHPALTLDAHDASLG